MVKGFVEIFKDSNDWNEKTIIGFMSFAVMVVIAVIDLTSGIRGKPIEIKDYIYQSFSYLTLGSFGIAGLEKFSPVNKARVDAEISTDSSGVPESNRCPNCGGEI